MPDDAIFSFRIRDGWLAESGFGLGPDEGGRFDFFSQQPDLFAPSEEPAPEPPTRSASWFDNVPPDLGEESDFLL